MGSSKRKNVDLEIFYTDSNLSRDLCDVVKSILPDLERVIDPSAGFGAFGDNFSGCISMDLNPRGDHIQKNDFLLVDLKYEPGTLIIGNPPFGRQSSLALKFLKKSLTLGDHVAFILPLSFKKNSVKSKMRKIGILIRQMDIPFDSFTDGCGKKCAVPVVFQIWRRRNTNDVIPIFKMGNMPFKFVDRLNADFAIRRVGHHAGEVVDDPHEANLSTHYFVRCDMSRLEEVKDKLREAKWEESSWTVGPRSISKQEICEYFI